MLRFPLTFLETDRGISWYRDAAGVEVALAAGPGIHVVSDLSDIDLAALWSEAGYDSDRFGVMLRMRLIDPSDDWEVAHCVECSEPRMRDDMVVVNDSDYACQHCCDRHYSFCDGCEEYVHDYSTYPTLGGNSVCRSCRDSYYSYCDHCDGYYHYEDSYEHEHQCDCEAPAQRFAISTARDMIDNDTEVEVSLPKGIISEDGLYAVRRALQQAAWELSEDSDRESLYWIVARLGDLGDAWQTKDGNFTKRLARMAYKGIGYKVDAELLSKIGNIARENSAGSDFTVAFTRDLNLPAEEFAHEESCWWTEYERSRCALKSNGGFGLRAFEENRWGTGVEGRAWVMPLKREDDRYLPTFNTIDPDAYVVFNGYGTLDGITAARIMSTLTGKAYRRIRFQSSPMYVNSESGFLVSDDSDTSAIHFSLDSHADLYHNENKEHAYV